MSDNQFRKFAISLHKLLEQYELHTNDREAFTKQQKEQITTLVKLENEFKNILIKDARGKRVYNKFIKYIIQDRHNILAARPFFRERQKTFSNKISKIIKFKNIKKLQKFAINYPFICFIIECEKWPQNGKLNKVKRKIEKLRTEIVELNLPFAISNAKMFWNKTPKSHLAYMDLIQLAAEGLINAVDKFVPPYTPVFRSVAIGRMKGNFMESYNETLLHFFPSDKKKLYRAHKSRSKADTDLNKIVEDVNEKVGKDNLHTTEGEIHELMLAYTHVSLDQMLVNQSEDDNNSAPIDIYAINPQLQPDNKVESNEAIDVLYKEINKLSLLEKKYLKMKGLTIL